VFLPEGAEEPRPGAEADGADLWRWGAQELSNTASMSYLGLELTADGRWDAHAAKARLKGFAALGACKQILTNRLITRTAKFAVVRSVIKPCVTYGSELWQASAVPTRALEGPALAALRMALGIPRGAARSMYPVDLLHYDSAIRLRCARACRVELIEADQTAPLARALQWEPPAA